MTTTIIADSNDDAVSRAKLVDSPNPTVSQSGYHSAQSAKTLQVSKICDVAPIIAEAKSQCTNGNKVTIGVQCDDTNVESQPGYVETSTKPTIYLIGEHLAVLKHVCAFYGIHVGRTAPMLNFGRRNISDDAAAMLQSIRRETPDLLWIQWHEQCREPSSRPNIRSAIDFFSGLCQIQTEAKRAVLLEGKAKDVPVRDEVFEGGRKLGTLLGQYQHQWWCQLGITNEDGNTVCGDHLVYSSPMWPGGTCQCKRQSSAHHASAGECYEQFIVQALCQFGLITQQQVRAPDQSWHNNQRVLKTKTGAKDYANDKSALVTVKYKGGDTAEVGRRKAVTFGDGKELALTQAVRTSSAQAVNEVTQAVRTSSAPSVSAFPTEAANRAKVKRKAREEELMKEEGGEEKVRLSRKRKPQEQEKHFDDCGSDMDILEESTLLASRLYEDPESGCYFDVEELEPANAGANSFTYYSDTMKDDYFMNAVDDHEFKSGYLNNISYFFKYINSLPDGHVQDVMEICGGEGGVTKVSIRRRLSTGQNFDLKHGIDLSRKEDQYQLLEYIDRHKPLFVVMAPPCTPFASWSKINRYKFPEHYNAQRETCIAIVRICVEVAKRQISNGRHFILENPSGSEMFKLAAMQTLWMMPQVFGTSFPQCALGLISPEGDPILKWTTLWTTSKVVIDMFQDCECTHAAGTHSILEGNFQGVPRTKLAQVWPLELCRRIVVAIEHHATMLRNHKRSPSLIYYKKKEDDGIVYDCPGCKWGRVTTDKSHTRKDEPPLLCRHPLVSTIIWKCKACESHKRHDDASHTRIEGECRLMVGRSSHQRPTAQGLKDPKPKPTAGPEGRNRLTGDLIPEEVYDPTAASSSSAPSTVIEPANAGATTGGDRAHASQEEIEAPGSDEENFEADPQDATAVRERKERSGKRDVAVTAGDGAKEDWKHFDISKAMTALRHPDKQIRTRVLQRLHVRWYHAQIAQMTQTLRAAGVPAQAIGEVKDVVNACVVCRDWHRPGTHNVATFKISLAFNEEVEFDLMFYQSLVEPRRGRLVIVHLVDCCIRWDVATVIANKEEDTILAAITMFWIAIFGPMGTLTLDEETGMRGRRAADWADAHNIQLRFKAPRQKAYTIERHNELLRIGLHGTETQQIKEGIDVPFEQTLAITDFMKNSLTVVNEATPYQGLLGRQPALLPPLEGGSSGQLEDNRLTRGTLSRHYARTREIAACKIIEATAQQRMERAAKHRSRPADELRECKEGQLVDIWFEPTHKEMCGWRGPAKVLSVNTGEGNSSVRFQGRTLDRRGAEIRNHIPYLVYFSAINSELMHYYNFVLAKCESLAIGQGITIGILFMSNAKQNANDFGWKLTKATTTTEGRKLLDASMIVASIALHMKNCMAVRLFRGVQSCAPLVNFDYCEMWIWMPPHAKTTPYIYTSEADDHKQSIDLRKLILDLPGVSTDNWQDACVIQFWCVAEEDAGKIIRLYPDINLLGGNGASSANSNVALEPADAGAKAMSTDHDNMPTIRNAENDGRASGKRHDSRPGTTPAAPDEQMPPPPPGGKPRRTATQRRSRSQPSATTTTTTQPPPPPAPPPAPAISIPSLQIGGSANVHYQPAGYNPPENPVLDHVIAPSTPSSVKSSSRRSRSTPGAHSNRSSPGVKSTTTMESDLSQNSEASTIPYPENMADSGGASSSHNPILPLRLEDAEEPANAGASASTDSEEEEDDKKMFLTWKEELLNHDADEGSLLSTDTGDSSEVDYISEMALHITPPVLLSAESVFSQQHDERPAAFSLPQWVEIGFDELMTRAHIGAGELADFSQTVVTYLSSDGSQKSVIVKEFDNLTKEELLAHKAETDTAKFGELRDLHGLGCYGRMRRSEARNVVDTRWVIKWKLVDGKRIVKVRITMRGFKDVCQSMETFAGTATRWAQRIVNSVAANEDDFVLFSLDVSKAFAKGMTFQELSELTGEPLRAVQFEVAEDDVTALRRIPGFEDFNPQTEVLTMLKPIYGLKDAPRAWRKKLDKVLCQWGLSQAVSDTQIYLRHHPSDIPREPVHTGAERRSLLMILSTHVDDLKGAAKRSDAESLLQHLEKTVGNCTQDWKEFTHTGIEHKQDDDGVYAHQTKYAEQLKPMPLEGLKDKQAEDLVDDAHTTMYMSLLGGVAWMVLTRSDISVYVQALQRRAQTPRKEDCKRLNVVCRYIKRRPRGLRYRKFRKGIPQALICFSDAAFKALVEESSGLALRGCCILIAETGDDELTTGEGLCHLIEFICGRQRRVVRSTYSAELNGLIDSIEKAILVQILFHQIWCGCDQSVAVMATLQEEGKLQPPIKGCVDAKAVFDSIKASDVCEPAESSLKLHLLAIRDKLVAGILQQLFWADTRDMLADGLTKGSVNRAALQLAQEDGRFKLQFPVVCTRRKSG